MKVNYFKFIKLIFKLRGLFILFIFVFVFLYLNLLKNTNKHISVLSNLDNKRIQIEYANNIRNNTTNEFETTTKIKINSELLKCKNYYDNLMLNATIKDNYNKNASENLLQKRIVRGLVFFFPLDKSQWYEKEFKWLYRSWIEMQKYEPELWRTDLILMIDVESLIKSNLAQFFNQLNCKTSNLRSYNRDEPMCTILDYKPIKKRIFNFNNTLNITKMEPMSLYSHLFHDIDVFNHNDSNLWKFYLKLTDLNDYNFVDSILVAFEGYHYFQNKFDFLLRSDMDIFLTPLFATWLPMNCNDFIVGRGAYSGNFNMKRLQKAAQNVKLLPGSVRNLGSTWYSTPNQFRFVSYLTLVSMIYVSNEEFSETERTGKLGVYHWPDWHYGVLLLYGQNLAMNHLISSKQMNITNLESLIDFPSTLEENISSKVHIHVFHGSNMFSKKFFKAGVYDNMTLPINNTHLVKYYCLNIALESKRKSLFELESMAKEVIKMKF